MESKLPSRKSRFQYSSLLADAVIGQAPPRFCRLRVARSSSSLSLRKCSDQTRQRFRLNLLEVAASAMARVSDKHPRRPAQFDKPASLIFAFGLMSEAQAE